MRPLGPEPLIWPRSMPLLSAILRAKGEAFTRSPLVEEAVATTSGAETGALVVLLFLAERAQVW